MCRRILAAVLVLVASVVATDRHDVPGDIISVPRAAGETGSDRSRPATQKTPTPVWTALEQMNGAERANSCIELELPEDVGSQAKAEAVAVADIWNRGQYEEALARLRSLGELVDPSQIAIGNCWRTPVPTMQTALWGNDVRIGNRHSISLVALDVHRAFGSLSAVLLYRVGPGTAHYWSYNHSPNGGTSWVETFTWYASYELRSLSASVLTDYCYVGYGAASPNREARLRRFHSLNGVPINFGDDNDEMYVTVYTTAASDSIKEVALTSNQDYFDNRLYYVALLHGGAVKYIWSDSLAVDWDTSYATGVTHASHGLDVCTNEGCDSTFLWISYYDQSRCLRIIGQQRAGNFRSYLTRPTHGGNYTSIGAYHDTILCAFDYALVGAVRYEANYGGGHPDSSWWYGYPAGDTMTASESPDVALRKGGGAGFIYRYSTPTHELRYIWRDHSGEWSTPVAIADHEPWYNRPAIENLGDGAYGVVYLRQSDYRAYFDRTDWPGIAEQRRLVMDENILSVTPNPLTGRGRLHYTLNRAASMRVQVFDRTGRVVRTLLEGHSPDGRQSVGFDAAGMAPGVYFIRADAGGQTLTVPMTVVK